MVSNIIEHYFLQHNVGATDYKAKKKRQNQRSISKKYFL